MNREKSQTSSPKAEDVHKEQPETLVEGECSTEETSSNSRKAALSKREIMEQLSRERFPWDE
jgi:hypothetical protein